MHRALAHLYTNDAPHVTACLACNAPAGAACAQCGVRYCGAACQARDWREGAHARICAALVGGREKPSLAQIYRRRFAQQAHDEGVRRETIRQIYESTFIILGKDKMDEVVQGMVGYLAEHQIMAFATQPMHTWPFFARSPLFWYLAIQKVFPDYFLKMDFDPSVDYSAHFYTALRDRKIRKRGYTIATYGDFLEESEHDFKSDDALENLYGVLVTMISRKELEGGDLQASDPLLWAFLNNRNAFWFYWYRYLTKENTVWDESARKVDWRAMVYRHYRLI